MTLSGVAFSKINLGLEILGLRPDGRHELRTWFVALDWGDYVEVEGAPDGVLELTTIDGPEPCPMQENLGWKAADALRRQMGVALGARVRIRKEIPWGAGLGGGSGDAAAVLGLCARLWGLPPDPDHLLAIGAELGADVPFLVRGGAAFGRGVGDVLTPAPHPAGHILVLVPPVTVSTGSAYRAWDELHPSPGLRASRLETIFADLPSSGEVSLVDLRGRLGNDFEEVVLPRHPIVEACRRDLFNLGAEVALLSGSGSSVFGLFEMPIRDSSREANWAKVGIRMRWCRAAGEANSGSWGVVKR